ncbi:MAG TPA: DnaJ C-terminal domain-containing protein [Alphaproteobacteria bacterium]|nr:DnaJ C-terminal domain-containing protein [Alphaproteobacteria bacterium]
MKDPYSVLGVAKTASADDIKKAYRKLAKQLHPDLNPGNAEASARFQDVSAAYDLLGDPEKKSRFDRGEIDATGQERPEAAYYRAYAGGPQGEKYRAGFDPSDLFADLFGRGARGGDFRSGGEFRTRGGDVAYALTVDFIEAAKGAQKRLTFPDGRALDVNVPPGTESGQILRLRGQGSPGIGGGPSGDALIEITVAPHPFFRREGNDIYLDLPVTLTEAIGGAKINVPTIDGPVSMSVPAASNTGTKLRLRGRGIALKGAQRGDQYVTLKVVLPKEPDAALKEFVKSWSGRDYDVRGPAGMGS